MTTFMPPTIQALRYEITRDDIMGNQYVIGAFDDVSKATEFARSQSLKEPSYGMCETVWVKDTQEFVGCHWKLVFSFDNGDMTDWRNDD